MKVSIPLKRHQILNWTDWNEGQYAQQKRNENLERSFVSVPIFPVTGQFVATGKKD
jgi:hypothetical protein